MALYGRTNPFEWDSLYLDVTLAPDSGVGTFEIVSYLLLYFALLWLGSYLIVVGSELLIFVPGMSSVVGSVVLPILGQLPIILLSIFAGFGADAQAELEVGVGGLAGGIIAQVSIYTFLTIFLAAASIDPKTGKADYDLKRSNTYYDYFFNSGVNVGRYTHDNSIYVIVTALPFVVLLVPNIIFSNDDEQLDDKEEPYDIFGFVFAFILFIIFIVNQYMVLSANDDTPFFDVRNQVLVNSLRKKLCSLVDILKNEVKAAAEEAAVTVGGGGGSGIVESTPLVRESQTSKREKFDKLREQLRRIIVPFLSHETILSKRISMTAVLLLFYELGEIHLNFPQLKVIFKEYLSKPATGHSSQLRTDRVDIGGDSALESADFSLQTLSIEEMLEGLTKFLIKTRKHVGSSAGSSVSTVVEGEREPDRNMEELGLFPADLHELSNEDQLFYLRLRASLYLVGGLLLTVYAVDPIILAIDELSSRMGISSFYAAFIYGGVDVSTLLAVARYASKRSDLNVFICQDTVLGSAVILNTLALGTFMAVVYSRGLAWEYLAEGSTIIIILGVSFFFFWFRTVHTVFEGFMLLLLFPLALLIVGIMRGQGYT